MKLSPRDLPRFLAEPDPARGAALFYGPDAMRVALKRKALVDALAGPDADTDMRLTRLLGADLRREGAALADAIKAVGFFPGQRVVVVEDATDGLTDTIASALSDWQPGDAFVVITAGQLAAKSKLRKLIEGHKTALAIAIYSDPPTRTEIEDSLAKAGLGNVSQPAMDALMDLGRALEPGDFTQTLAKLALYKLDETEPVSVEDVANCAPLAPDADLDSLLHLVAEGRPEAIGPIMRNLAAQGHSATAICIGATRHLRLVHAALSAADGAETALSRMRPPVFGPRRDRILQQVRKWRRDRLEEALSMMVETDLSLRSARNLPDHAYLERSLIRVAFLGRSNR